MKKMLLFSMFAIVFMSCGGSGQHPDDYITWGQAFNHVAHSFSYWFFIAVTVLAVAAYIIIVSKSDDGWNQGRVLVLFVLLALFLMALLMRPSEVAANTTVEQAARGVYIGY